MKALALAAICAASQAHGAVQIFTDEAAFLAQLDPTAFEDFDDDTVDYPITIYSYTGYADGYWHDYLLSGVEETHWKFDLPIMSFGGRFGSFAPSGGGILVTVFGSAITGSAGQSQVIGEIPSGYGFWGFSADIEFDEMWFQSTGVYGYSVDDVGIGYSHAPEPVPLPASAFFLGPAIFGLAALARRRRRS